MNMLPKVDKAFIPIEKLTKYALNPDCDQDKVIAFELALGYKLDNYEELRQNIYKNLKNYEALPKGHNGFGEIYEVTMNLIGANGKTAKVLTVWIDDDETGEMRLVTLHID